MESNYSNRDFEQFIKQNADQYRMFPSEKVWKSINTTLHTRRKWYNIWLALLLLLSGITVTWIMMTYPSSKNQDLANPANNHISDNGKSSANSSTKSPSQTIESLLPFSNQNNFVQAFPSANNLILLPNAYETSISNLDLNRTSSTTIQNDDTGVESRKNSLNLSSSGTIWLNKMPDLILNYPNQSEVEKVTDFSTLTENSFEIENQLIPFSIESVINSYKYLHPKKKISWQLFVTPTVSYRKLSINKEFDNLSPSSNNNNPLAYLSDVNSAVTHKPDLGLQIGLSGRYDLFKHLKIRGGVQFNINRYDIKAYQFTREVATIDLNGGPGFNSISTWTYYRNFNGYKSDWLKNYYFSVSAPIGLELNLLGNKKSTIGIAGTIQPTYILKDKAYLISTDFKNYAEVPRLIRHLNLNTGFETFVNFTNGKMKWQIGPQVRYQLLSSFQNQYPVKENLFDFGLKVGLTLNE